MATDPTFTLYDTTLRDGAQGEGVHFSLPDNRRRPKIPNDPIISNPTELASGTTALPNPTAFSPPFPPKLPTANSLVKVTVAPSPILSEFSV